MSKNSQTYFNPSHCVTHHPTSTIYPVTWVGLSCMVLPLISSEIPHAAAWLGLKISRWLHPHAWRISWDVWNSRGLAGQISLACRVG